MKKNKPIRLEGKIAELKDNIWSYTFISSLILAVMFPYDFKPSSIIWFLVILFVDIFGIIFQIVKLKNLKKRWE